MLPNNRKWEGEEEQMLSDFEKEYHHRVQRLQHYVPFLKKMIEHLEGARDKNRETQLTKMRSLLNILTDSHKKLKLTTIQRCEEILQKLYSKVEGAFEWSTGLPNVKEKLNINVNKHDVEKEGTQSSNGSIHSPQTMESPLSMGSSSRDDSCNSLWRRRKTAMDFFEETPRSPSPPPCSELGNVPQPLVIPMEWKEESVENPVTISSEQSVNQPILTFLESKAEIPPMPLKKPLERREDFETKWYQGDCKYADSGRQNSKFGAINSSVTLDPGIGHRNNNVPQSSFTQEMTKYSPLQSHNSNVASDIPSLEELRIQRRGDIEYHGSERLHIPISEGGEKYVKDYDHCKQPSPGWSDVAFEGRRNRLPFHQQNEPSNISVIGKAQVYDYGHGQNSASDSFEGSKESSAESECDKTKSSPKNVSSARASIREKLALEINKVHRVGVSSGGALRSLSKDLGSPPHHKKAESRDTGQGCESIFRKTPIPSKTKDSEQTTDKSPKDRERMPSGSLNLAEDDVQIMNSSSSFIIPSESVTGSDCTDIQERNTPHNSCDAGKDETISTSNKMHLNDESKNTSSIHPESSAHEVSGECRIIEEFSFKKKLLESKITSDGKLGLPAGSPSIPQATSVNSEDEDQNSKMSLCGGDSDSDSKIPFLDSSDSAPPPDPPNFPPLGSPCGFSDQRYLPSPCISPAPLLSSSNMIHPFVNPSNPSHSVPQGNIREESTKARIWPTSNPVGMGVFPPFCPQNSMQPNVNSPNANNSNQVIHHSITPNRLVQSNNPPHNHNLHVDSPRLVQQSQYMSGGSHPVHNMNVPSINQGNRPPSKQGLLPDPGPQFRLGGGHNWSQGHGSSKSGLLPHPMPRPPWRKEAYTRPVINQYMTEPRSSGISTGDARSHNVRGSWNSRRGGYSKVNDPRIRKPDHSRSYCDSSEPQKKSEEKFWKHPSDPRRANPAILENKRPTPPVPKDKTTISSPLNSLYDADQTPKTGKGYGLQKFRIPKIKSHDSKATVYRPQNPPRAVSPPRGISSCQKDRAESTQNVRTDDGMKGEKINEDSKKEDRNQERNSKEINQSSEDKSEELDKEDKEKKAKEEFTKELFQTLLKISLESKEGTTILDNSKFLDELREKLKLNPRKKSRPIIESDTETSEEEEEASPVVNKTKKRCRVIIESSESESCDDGKQTEVAVVAAEKSPAKTPPYAKRTSTRKATKISNVNLSEERPRTRSQRKLFNVEEDVEQVVMINNKEDEPLEEEGDHQVLEMERNDEVSNVVDVTSTTKTPSRRTKRRSSLELLQEDIREMFICEGVMSATGVRMCRLLKEAATVSATNDEISIENSAGKDSEEWEESSVSSCKDGSAPDQSEEHEEITPPRLTRRRGSGRKEKITKVTSLQPRVLLKKAEVGDGSDFIKTTQTTTRGGYARRSIKRTLNVGNRHLSSPKSLLEELQDEEEGSVSVDNEDEKEHLDDKEIQNTVNINTSVDGKISQSSEGNQLFQLNDIKASDENSDNSFEGESLCEGDNLEKSDENIQKCSNNVNVDKKEVAGKENLVGKASSGNSTSRFFVKRPNLKKVNSKARRSKVNRKWALGVLKRAVNHKRRGLSASSTPIISTEPTIVENVIPSVPEEDLVDVNYTCIGSESFRCKLCTYNGKQIVNHYVTKHPESDVIVSRLSLQQAKIAMDWTETNQGALRNAKQAFKSHGPFVCIMCEAWFTDYTEFHDHVTTHTGEYRFSCKMCSYRSFRDTNVRSHAYYVHQKKYSESSQCYEAVPIEDLLFDIGEEKNDPETLSSVIPGLVAHLCSKCNFVQISEKGVEGHIAKRHREDDAIKILKIDMSLISPEPPSGFLCVQNKDEEEDDVTNFISEEANASSGDDDDGDMSALLSSPCIKKEETEACDWNDMVKVKNEGGTADVNEDVNELDESVFLIDKSMLLEPSNENSTRVWHEILENPECNEEISIIKFKLLLKIDCNEEKCSKSYEAGEINSANLSTKVGDNNPPNLPVTENELSGIETVSEMAGVSDFGVIHHDGGKKPEEPKPDGAESHTSEVEIIEIYDESDPSESEDSSDSETSSESEDEWNAPSSSNKENLFSLDIVPEVKVQTHLLDITNKVMKVKEVIKNLETKALVLLGDGNVKDVKGVEECDTIKMTEAEPSTSQNSGAAQSDKLEEGEEPKPGKIRVRCLSGDLLSSTKDVNPVDEHNNSERDPFIDVIGTSPGFDACVDNPLCQISSVCSLHPNEQVPEEFIKAVSENETPDLTSLAAYTPTTGSPQSMFSTPEDVMGDRVVYISPVKGSKPFRTILPKGPLPVRLAAQPSGELTGAYIEDQNLHQSNPVLCQSSPEKLANFPNKPPKMPPHELEGFGGQTLGQPCSQVKMCSIMRASLYAKASKTPTVFNQVLSNEMKLCHLFKCMGRQCSFTTDEPVIFLSHYLGHESLVSDPPAASSSSSGENSENQERRFDWQQCCYCAEMFSSASAYIKHVKAEHGECTYQCPYCFYRAAAVSYVILHQNSTHLTEKVSVLQCKNPLKKGADEDKTLSLVKPHIEAYVCFQGNCKRSMYSPSKYLSHLQLEHSALSIFCCHKCSFQCFKAERLVQHYKLHSFFLYQCVYCEQGSDTSEEILQHLASFHPNKKASVCKRNCQETSNGSARTTGRHPYILYEDIELTEMENVEVIRVGEEIGKKSIVTSVAIENSVSRCESDPESNQIEEFIEMDDDNSDDEDNLVIAEEPEEETSGKENEDSIVEMETTSKGEEMQDVGDHHKENNVEVCNEEELMQEREIEKITETIVLDEIDKVGSESQYEEGKNKEAKSDERHESEIITIREVNEPLLSPPNSNKNVSRRNSFSKPPNVEESVIWSPKGNKAPKNRDELNVSTIDDEIIDVSEGYRNTSGGEEMRLLRKRDAKRPARITTRSQVEPKSKSSSSTLEESPNAVKEVALPKDPSNSKVDICELYHCCFPGCSFLAKDCNNIKYHMKNCPHSKGNTAYVCPHCNRKFKSLPPMLKHLRGHGKKLYICMICNYQGHNMNLAVRHVKFRHRAASATVSPLTDWDEPEELQSSAKDQKLVVVAPKEVSISFLLKKRFVPDDADFLPLPCVYTHEAKCARCSYSTKVRVNMRRHLYLHLRFNQGMEGASSGPNQVPWSVKDIVNPMPCLEGKEMMFDKMTNWAISSHLDAKLKEEEDRSESRRNSAISEYEEDNFIPRFVPENERYVCGVIGCHYQTVDDTMLRHHLRALHREEATFRCAHCPDDQNVLLQVPVDRLASHLKMHDDQLYQCIHCNYFHFQRRFVERHTIDKHSDLSHMVNIIREPDTFSKAVTGPGSAGMAGTGSDGSIRSSNANSDLVKNESDNIWNCGLCSYSCSNRGSISDHARVSHSVFSQYVCGMCTFRTAYLASFTMHFSSKHLGYPVQLVANYFRNNISVLAPPTITIALPNGKIIFPPNPLSSKSVDIRSEPVIEVWPYVEQGFGKSSSSSVRLKELNTTYPWQRCMPRVRYIRGIPLADEGEETMYDLAESLKIKDEIQNDGVAEKEHESHSKSCKSEESEVPQVDESGEGTDVEEIESPVNRIEEHLPCEEVKKGAKRRLSDPSRAEGVPVENRRRTESGRSLTPVKASPNKRSSSGILPTSPVHAKVPKVEPQEDEVPKIVEKIEEVAPVVTKDASQEDEKQSQADPVPSKVEFLIKQYGEFGVPEGNLFVCPLCSKYKTKYKGDMKDHFYRELNYKRFVCTHCGFLVPAKNRLQKHYLRVHKKEGKREAIAELPPDNDIELWVSHALNHQCGMMKSLAQNQVPGSSSCEGIMKTSGNSLQTPSGDGAATKTHYSCKYCVSKFATARGVKIHFKVYHLKIGSWICGYCDVSANSSAIIVKHSKASHPDRPELIINNNIGSFIDAKALEDSVRIYGGGLPTPNSFDKSVSKNSGGSLFHCSLCDYQTNQGDDLKKHEESHNASKPYCCGHCNFTAAQESDVSDHHASNHPALSPEITNRLDNNKDDQFIGTTTVHHSNAEDSDVTIIDPCGEPEGSKEVGCDIAVEQEIVVTLENIGEFGKSNPSFVFKCYYCRMKSFSCDDVVNHWENVHLPTDIHNTHPFKCKRIFAMNHFTFPHQLFQCAFCKEKGTVIQLKGHFKADHRQTNFKILNLQNTKYCCLLCEFSSFSFTTLENHFRNIHSWKDMEYQMRLASVNGNVRENCSSAEEGVVLGTVIGNSFKANSKRDTSVEEQFLKDALFSCCVCNYTYSAFNVLEKHHTQNHGSSTLRFTIEVKSLKSNESSFHPCENIIKTYSCSSCSFSTQSFSKMFEHIRRHAMPYKCGHCNFRAELPSKVCEQHFKDHPIISLPMVVITPQADTEMANLYKELKVACEVAEPRGVAPKRRAPSPLLCEPKKYCPVARKSTTQVFPSRGFQKPTARKSTNPSAGLVRKLKLLQDSQKPEEPDEGNSSSEEQDSDSAISDGDGENDVTPPPSIEEFSYYKGGKDQFKQSVNLSRITVWMTFGGCAAKRVPVSKMAQLVDLEPCLYLDDVLHGKDGS